MPRHLHELQPQLEGKRLLIAVHNDTNRRILVNQTKAWGMEPATSAAPEQALEWIRRGDPFDLVILDCPPLLPVADTHVIGEVVDKALLVVRAGATPRAMLEQAIEDFGKDKFLGAVLNRTQPKDIPYFREVYGYYRRDSARG